jgi:MFS family permease
VIEGVAESTAALLKLASGIISDRVRSRKGLVLAGYGISSLARPLVAAATAPVAVLAIRFADRVGKGIRTSPRDALIADSTEPSLRGTAFGFHRSMDHAGALVGPLVATALLTWYVTDVRTVFWLAAIPGILSVLLIASRVREVGHRQASDGTFLRLVPSPALRRYLFVIVTFTLGNSSDAFLLLRANQLGVSPARIPLLWAFFHMVKMLASTPCGALSDRIGRRGMIVACWVIYALSYLGFALAESEAACWLLFAVYGLFYGMTEGVEKALVADIVAPAERGGAFGWYHCAVGVAALPASLLFGLVWERAGQAAAFALGAGLAAVAAVLLLLFVKPAPPALVPARDG